MNKIKLIKRGDRMYANPIHLIPNPLNKELYTNEEEELRTQSEIADSYKIRIERGQCPNEQPIVIWPDGRIDAGHTRHQAALKAGVDVWVVYTDKPELDYENAPFTALESVSSSNIHRKMTHSVRLNEFEQKNKAYVIEFGIARTTTQEDEHIKKLGTSRATIKQLLEIKKNRPDLLPLVDSSEWSVKAAYDEATGKNKVKVIKSNNPNRDWSGIYTMDVFKSITQRVSNCINQMRDISYKLNGEDYNPLKDFVKAAIASNISWLFESIGAEVLRGENHDVRCASGHPTDPDIYHNDIDDKVEIKVTNFDGATTKWKGGQGIREGQYILVAYDELIERWLIIFTKLTQEDWKSAGMGGHTLPIKNVLDNHKNDMVVVYGDLYENNGKVVAQLQTLK